MTLTTVLIGLLSAFVGSLGFALIFRLRPRYLLPGSIGGMLAYAVYLATDLAGLNIFAANFLAAASAALFSELCARFLKAPAVVFSIPCLIPLVPGSLLYYSMSHLLAGRYADSFLYFKGMLLTAIGIAGGLIIVSVFFSIFSYFYQKHKKKRAGETR